MNEAEITQKACAATWADENNNSLKQTDLSALLREAGTNAIWASKLQLHFTLSNLWNDFFLILEAF